jgi:hypothetical protein
VLTAQLADCSMLSPVVDSNRCSTWSTDLHCKEGPLSEWAARCHDNTGLPAIPQRHLLPLEYFINATCIKL